MRKLLTIIVYTIIILLIGRNLEFLPRFPLFNDTSKKESQLTQQVKQQAEKELQDTPGNYAMYYADLTSNERFGINENEVFTGASVNKVHIVAALYYLASKGKIDLEEKITLQKEDLQDYGTGSLRYQGLGKAYSLKTLAKLSLQESDNTAAHVLGNKISTAVIQKTIEGFGLTQTNMEKNQTSPYDMYLLFKKIYSGQITDPAHTKELLGFMTDTDIEDRLPAHLPKDAIVYHKTGDAVGSMHDVGIVEQGNSQFFLAVFTSDIGNRETDVKNSIANTAKAVLGAHTTVE